MEAFLLVARLTLAAVFGVAGSMKLMDRAATRRALKEFGLPSWLVQPTVLALPLTELVVAFALIPTTTVEWAATGAVGFLLLFMAMIALNLAKGRRPRCHCFGQLRSTPISFSTLVRNAMLAVVAGGLAWVGRDNAGPSFFGWLDNSGGAEPLLFSVGALGFLLLAVEGWLLLYLLKQYGRLTLRLDATWGGHGDATYATGLPIGTAAPDFSLVDAEGRHRKLADLHLRGKSTVLIFSNSNCTPCSELMPAIQQWQHEYSDRLTIAVIAAGDVEVNRSKAAEHGILWMLQQESHEVNEAYQAVVTPSAVAIRSDGTIGNKLAVGDESIRGLIKESADRTTADTPLFSDFAALEPALINVD